MSFERRVCVDADQHPMSRFVVVKFDDLFDVSFGKEEFRFILHSDIIRTMACSSNDCSSLRWFPRFKFVSSIFVFLISGLRLSIFDFCLQPVSFIALDLDLRLCEVYHAPHGWRAHLDRGSDSQRILLPQQVIQQSPHTSTFRNNPATVDLSSISFC